MTTVRLANNWKSRITIAFAKLFGCLPEEGESNVLWADNALQFDDIKHAYCELTGDVYVTGYMNDRFVVQDKITHTTFEEILRSVMNRYLRQHYTIGSRIVDHAFVYSPSRWEEHFHPVSTHGVFSQAHNTMLTITEEMVKRADHHVILAMLDTVLVSARTVSLYDALPPYVQLHIQLSKGRTFSHGGLQYNVVHADLEKQKWDRENPEPICWLPMRKADEDHCQE